MFGPPSTSCFDSLRQSMRLFLLTSTLVIAVMLTGTASQEHQAPPAAAPATNGATTMTIDVLAQRILQSESAVTARLSSYKPLVEVYVQYVEPHAQLGTVP